MKEKMIEVTNLSFKYPAQNEFTLKEVNFSIAKGEKVALLGASGKGKSTLLKLIASYREKQDGSIKINSKEIDTKTIDDSISYLPQNAEKALFLWMRVKNNLYYPAKLRKGNLTKEYRQFCDFCDKCAKGFGLDKVLNNFPLELSGGEKKRLSVIMALSVKPDVVLLDEPFAGLDFETTENIWKFLREYFAENNTTVLLVTHSIDEAAVMADRVIFLDKDSRITPLENESFQKYADRLTTDEDKRKLKSPGTLLLLPQFNEYKKKIKEEYENHCTKNN
jgi:ABC-type multidrug transport system ATPase subunit